MVTIKAFFRSFKTSNIGEIYCKILFAFNTNLVEKCLEWLSVQLELWRSRNLQVEKVNSKEGGKSFITISRFHNTFLCFDSVLTVVLANQVSYLKDDCKKQLLTRQFWWDSYSGSMLLVFYCHLIVYFYLFYTASWSFIHTRALCYYVGWLGH